MRRFLWSAPLLAILLGATPASVSVAKPPDLPAAIEVRCVEAEGQFQLDVPSGLPRFEIEIDGPARAEVGPPCIDAWCPSLVPLVMQRLAHALAGVAQQLDARSRQGLNVAVPIRTSSTTNVIRAGQVDEECDTAEQARLLFEIAGRCARAGNLGLARARLCEAHMVSPTSHYGQLAIQRLLEMEADDESDEATVPTSTVPDALRRRIKPESAEPPSDDEASQNTYRRIRETTQPLGLVALPTY